MSISRLVARDVALKAKQPENLMQFGGAALTPDLLLDAKARKRAPQAASDEQKPNAVSSALEVLSRYFPTEVVAIYIFGLSGLKTVSEDLCGTNNAACLGVSWWVLLVVCAVLTLFFVTINWLAARNAEATLSFPVWPLAASLIAFLVWAIATPGNPLITTGGAALLAGFVALTSSHVLAGLELILGAVARTPDEQ